MPPRASSTILSNTSSTRRGGGDAARALADEVAPVEHDLAAEVGDESHDDLERGRLARPVRADHRDHLALVHVERHAVEDLDRSVAGLDVAEREERQPS